MTSATRVSAAARGARARRAGPAGGAAPPALHVKHTGLRVQLRGHLPEADERLGQLLFAHAHGRPVVPDADLVDGLVVPFGEAPLELRDELRHPVGPDAAEPELVLDVAPLHLGGSRSDFCRVIGPGSAARRPGSVRRRLSRSTAGSSAASTAREGEGGGRSGDFRRRLGGDSQASDDILSERREGIGKIEAGTGERAVVRGRRGGGGAGGGADGSLFPLLNPFSFEGFEKLPHGHGNRTEAGTRRPVARRSIKDAWLYQNPQAFNRAPAVL